MATSPVSTGPQETCSASQEAVGSSPDELLSAAHAALTASDGAEFDRLVDVAACHERGKRDGRPAAKRPKPSTSEAQSAYLSKRLSYSDGLLRTTDGEAVMMDWEEGIMRHHAASMRRHVGARPAPAVLNIGFGLGCVDEMIQQEFRGADQLQHVIVEAHPDVLAHARSSGWDLRPGVRLELGRWQEVVPRLVDSGATFDAVYYDTYAETYADLRAFLLWLPRLLRADGVAAYFHGAAPTVAFFHAVYCRMAQLDVAELRSAAGRRYRLTFEPVELGPLSEETWAGVPRKRYWADFPVYLAPRITEEPPADDVSLAAPELQPLADLFERHPV